MKSINLFKNLVLVWAFVLHTGFALANESTQDTEEQKPTAESTSDERERTHLISDLILLTSSSTAVGIAIPTVSLSLKNSDASFTGLITAAIFGSAYMCQQAFKRILKNQSNKNNNS